MTETVIVGIISAMGASGIAGALVALFKERKKDNATAKLTDVQALQQQVILLTQVSDFLRKENDQLQRDYQESEESRRKMRAEMEQLQRELQEVRLSAGHTQDQCDRLSAKLKLVMGEENK